MKYARILPLLLLWPTLLIAGPWDTEYRQVEQGIRQVTFAGKTFDISKWGARTDAPAAVNRKAINLCITACSKAGGGCVVVPKGRWLTGAITLKSGVCLVVAKDATLEFSPDTKLYPLVLTRWEGLDCWNYQPMIYACKAKNVGIAGEGTIDGAATSATWWKMSGAERFGWKEGDESQRSGSRLRLQQMSENGTPVDQRKFGEGCGLRPQLINFNQCDGVLIEGVTLLRSPFWVIHPLLSKNITVRGVHVQNEGPNGDGCDPESCNGVLIENCSFHTGDDCIAIKSGRNADGRRWNRPSENIIVRNCQMQDGHGGVVVGSEISGGCRNLFVENCTMDSPNLERVIRLKTNSCRGGVIENIFVRNVEVGQCREAVLKINLDYEHNEQCCRGFNPTVRNVFLDHVNCKKSQYGMLIIGLDSATNVYNIEVSNSAFDGVTSGGNSVTGLTRDIRLKNVTINGSLVLSEPPFKHYSEWLVASEMRRTPKSYLLDFAPKPRWSYVMGIEQEAMLDVYLKYKNPDILRYLKAYPDTMILADGSIRTYDMKDWNLDQVRTGRYLLRLNKLYPQEKCAKAIKTLFTQLKKQPRTKEGIWWHKQVYPEQVWLDGIFMGLPFYTMAAPMMTKHPEKIYDDALNQILNTARLTYDSKTSLYRHAWDETHSLFWADKTTGLSQHTWGRAQGWMSMAIVELLDVLPENYSRRGELIALLNKVMGAVVKYQDKKTGLWYQVMDVADSRKENYLEATCSSMFSYVLLKGARKGYLDESFRHAGMKGFNGIVKNFIRVNKDSTISLTRCCEVAGLGRERSRDGSFEYYISEPIRDNDAKGVGPFVWAALEMEMLADSNANTMETSAIEDANTEQKIDRRAVVDRNSPTVTTIDPLGSLTVGNGHFAATVDVTGLQSFPEYYKNGIPLCTESDWGWHSFPNKENLKPEETLQSLDLGHGRKELYAVEYKNGGRGQEASNYFRVNPHRLNLGTVGLRMADEQGEPITIDRVSDVRQHLDLWSGMLTSRFWADDAEMQVVTFCPPDRDGVVAKLTMKEKRNVQVTFRFSYPTGAHSDDANDWTKPERHQTTIVKEGSDFAVLKRVLDGTTYYVNICWDGKASFQKEKEHCFSLTPKDEMLCFSCSYSDTIPTEVAANVDVQEKATATRWHEFWRHGAMVDFSRCTDARAPELERRVILSEYLTAIQCAGSMPPQESGLTYNTWFGRPHLEMAWWHLLHFSLWGREDALSRAFAWYNDTAFPVAEEIAHRQGFDGVRWMKMTDPQAGEAPSNVGSFLIWQQPHYIYLAEELYRANPTQETLQKYAKGVDATARFCASFASFNKAQKQYELHGATAMQESVSKNLAFDQPFELAYWRYALTTAQKWRERQGLKHNILWDNIIDSLAPLPRADGIYLAGVALQAADSSYRLACRSDHPAVLGVCGMLPSMGQYDAGCMKNTYQWVKTHWNWATTWGWDYGMMAMAAARLGLPDEAVDALLCNKAKNTYLPNGHNYQDQRLRVYLPGNGALLEAIAMMCAGWDGGPETVNPGFPHDGKWNVRWEGFRKMQ